MLTTALRLVAVVLVLGSTACSTVKNHPDHSSPIAVAKAEAVRRGWKNPQVGECTFRDGYWHVYVYRVPLTTGSSTAWVLIATDGSIARFVVSTR
jgi:hypothetical protein